MVINPPPTDLCCECCGKQVEFLYNPMKENGIWDNGMNKDLWKEGKALMKSFREENGIVSASWECYDCMGLDDNEYNKMRAKRWKK